MNIKKRNNYQNLYDNINLIINKFLFFVQNLNFDQ